MPKLTLKFDDRIIKEYVIEAEATIGRLPDNTLVIDNPAVSGHHARVFLDGDEVIVEDLRSKNGTYMNDQHVVRAALKKGDVLLIGKHRIEYDDASDVVASPVDGAATPTMGATAYLDTRQHRAMLATLREARAARDRGAATSSGQAASGRGATAAPTGVLRVLAGSVDGTEYTLHGQRSIIGKSETALVRLRGLFKPREAAAIVKEGGAYFVTPAAGRALVNGEHFNTRRELRDGDVLDIAGVLLEFRVKGDCGDVDPHPHVA